MDAASAHGLSTKYLAQAGEDVDDVQKGNLQGSITYFDAVATKLSPLGILHQAMTMLLTWSPKRGSALFDEILVRDPLVARKLYRMLSAKYDAAGHSLKPWWLVPAAIGVGSLTFLGLLMLLTRSPR